MQLWTPSVMEGLAAEPPTDRHPVESLRAENARLNRPRTPGASTNSRSADGESLRTFDWPDEEMVHLTRREIERSGGKLSRFEAQLKVLRGNPELAERYRHMPGVKDQ